MKIEIKITGYTTDMIELQSALLELVEKLEDDIGLEMSGKAPNGNLYAGDEEFCQLFLKISPIIDSTNVPAQS